MEETALAKYEAPRAQTALEPHNFAEAEALATKISQANLGAATAHAPKVLAVVLAGRELGLTAMQSIRSIHLIEGKVTLSADLMVALCKRSRDCKFFRLVKSDATIATYETEREGEGKTPMSFTIEEAKAANLTGRDNWKKYPAAMLRARCSAALARAVYPDLMVGIYDPEEISEGASVPAAVVVTSTATPVEPDEPMTMPSGAEVTSISSPAEDPTEKLIADMHATKSQGDLEALGAEIGGGLKTGRIPAEKRDILLKVYESVAKRWVAA
jgi:hypothetical protein